MLKPRSLLPDLLLVAFVLSAPADAANRVTVQSKTFRVNSGPDTVGILLENDINIVAFVVPIEMRSVSGGAFIRPPFTNDNFRWQEVPGSRVATSPLGEQFHPEDLWPPAFVAKQRYSVVAGPTEQKCSGPTSNTYSAQAVQCDGVSPDGLLYTALSSGDPDIGEEISMLPGVDVTPSLEIIFPVNGNQGQFEIDTCCMRPAHHLSFVNEDLWYVPGIQFSKGTITLIPCACDCLGDPICDSVISDVVDVVRTIDVAFRNTPEAMDPDVTCPRVPTDVDCSRFTDVIDVVKVVNVAFRNADPATEYCDPCP